MVLFKSKDKIDQYLETEIFSVLGSGGFVPTIDHLVPTDTSWKSFSYYRDRLNRKIDSINTYAIP